LLLLETQCIRAAAALKIVVDFAPKIPSIEYISGLILMGSLNPEWLLKIISNCYDQKLETPVCKGR
jgi:hypothetical protein